MSYFKKFAQLIWVGSSVRGLAGTPNLIQGIGTGGKSVSLSEIGLSTGALENEGEKRLCGKMNEAKNLIGLGWKGSKVGWWWNRQDGGDQIIDEKEKAEFDKCGKQEIDQTASKSIKGGDVTEKARKRMSECWNHHHKTNGKPDWKKF